jgi:Uncharacterized protein conserved in archaea
MNKIEESFYAYGHEKIKSTHKTTLEITKEDYLTEKGDCIVAIKSEKSCADLNNDLKNAIRKDGSKVLIKLVVGNEIETVEAYGSKKLILNNSTSIVIRKSEYIDDRTLAIRSNKSANDLRRDFIDLLKDNNVKIKIVIEVLV